MRRRTDDQLVPNEQRTLRAAALLRKQGIDEFHGYLLAGQLRQLPSTRRVMAYSTVYRCLSRLEARGLVRSRLGEVATSGGPRRRIFALTDIGVARAGSLPVTDDGLELPEA